MNLIKKITIAVSLILSLGLFSSTASALCLGMACMYNRMTPIEGIDATTNQIKITMKIIQARHDGNNLENDDLIVSNIKEALKLSKEINANDKLDRNRNRANDSLKRARTAVQEGNLTLATELLNEAEKRFSDLKSMIDLTQADRVSQQTNLLNRILDTPDTAAGARK